MEVWKDIPGYEGLYQVSNLGRVKGLERYVDNGPRSHRPEQIKKPVEAGSESKTNGQRYLQVGLWREGKGKSLLLHRLVAEAFIPNPEKKTTVNHKNGDKHDNRVENLEWSTQQENNRHAVANGLNGGVHQRNKKGSIPVAQYDKDMNLIAIYPSMREAQRVTGISEGNIRAGILKGWKHGGFIWKKAQ